MTDDETTMVRKLAYMLDASIDALDKAAAIEKRREEGKTMRQITERERAKNARKLVDEAMAMIGEAIPS